MTTSKNTTTKDVAVVIGAGGIGQAIARRQGSGKLVLLADLNEQVLKSATEALEAGGHEATTRSVDVSKRESVRALADAAAQLGAVTNVVHTAGLSPVQASAQAILAVDLVGTTLVLEEFQRVIAAGGAGLVISSMAGHMIPALGVEMDKALAETPADELLAPPASTPPVVRGPA
jgi:NAD(P)-dependent dehydrogenase (short-subunit alcohol dehydrogenase family)